MLLLPSLDAAAFFSGTYGSRIAYTANRGGWNCGRGIGICALALGLGILVAAIFPVGCLMFIVAFLLIACGICCMRQ